MASQKVDLKIVELVTGKTDYGPNQPTSKNVRLPQVEKGCSLGIICDQWSRRQGFKRVEMPGVNVVKVTEGSAAQKAGLNGGDVITGLEMKVGKEVVTKSIKSVPDLANALKKCIPGQELKINYNDGTLLGRTYPKTCTLRADREQGFLGIKVPCDNLFFIGSKPVSKVVPESPAAVAGIEAGDDIISMSKVIKRSGKKEVVENARLDNISGFLSVCKKGDEIIIRYKSGKELRQARVRLTGTLDNDLYKKQFKDLFYSPEGFSL